MAAATLQCHVGGDFKVKYVMILTTSGWALGRAAPSRDVIYNRVYSDDTFMTNFGLANAVDASPSPTLPRGHSAIPHYLYIKYFIRADCCPPLCSRSCALARAMCPNQSSA